MKALWIGAAALLAGAGVCVLPAVAADSAEYMNQCKANTDSAQLPQGVTKDDVIEFCQCMVDEVGDNQSALDEMVAFGKLSQQEQMSRMQSGEKPSKAVQDAFQACAPEGMGPPQQ